MMKGKILRRKRNSSGYERISCEYRGNTEEKESNLGEVEDKFLPVFL